MPLTEDAEPRTGALPAIWHHAKRVYDLMEENAVVQTLDGYGEVLVYEGFLTHLFQTTGMSTPYYSKVTRVLEGTKAAAQIRRGGGSAPSQWVLFNAPTNEMLEEFERREGKSTRGKRSALQQQLNDVNSRVLEIEDYIDDLVERVQRLEKEAEENRLQKLGASDAG